jgi:hypothetical protein
MLVSNTFRRKSFTVTAGRSRQLWFVIFAVGGHVWRLR